MRIGRGVLCVDSLANIWMVQFTLVGAFAFGWFGWSVWMDGFDGWEG